MLFSGWFVTVLALTRLYVIVGSWWCLVWLQPWLHTTACSTSSVTDWVDGSKMSCLGCSC